MWGPNYVYPIPRDMLDATQQVGASQTEDPNLPGPQSVTVVRKDTMEISDDSQPAVKTRMANELGPTGLSPPRKSQTLPSAAEI